MQITLQRLLVIALLAGLATACAAQEQAAAPSKSKTAGHRSRHKQHSALHHAQAAQKGEAQRLQAKEAGRDSEPQPSHPAASLKTGQWTASHTKKFHTRQASLNRPSHSAQLKSSAKSGSDISPAAAPAPNKNTHEIHLKKHNARMF